MLTARFSKTSTAESSVYFLSKEVIFLETITTAISNAVTCVGTAFSAMIDNPVIAIFVGCSLVGAAVTVFARMKRAAR